MLLRREWPIAKRETDITELKLKLQYRRPAIPAQENPRGSTTLLASFMRSFATVLNFLVSSFLRSLSLSMVLVLVLVASVYAQKSDAGSNAADSVTLSIIVVSSQTDAERILQQLHQGKDFASLSKRLSVDTTADTGGSMGTVSPSSLRPEIRDAVRELRPGELSHIIRVPLG